jgi:hypothetical protein
MAGLRWPQLGSGSVLRLCQRLGGEQRRRLHVPVVPNQTATVRLTKWLPDQASHLRRQWGAKSNEPTP